MKVSQISSSIFLVACFFLSFTVFVVVTGEAAVNMQGFVCV